MSQRPTIAQFPNPPLILAFAAGAVANASPRDHTARAAAFVSHTALLVWAYQEVTAGANWFRSMLGLGGAVYALGPFARR